MPMSNSNVFLYAATLGDFEKALAAADVSGIPRAQVIGNFSKAWSIVANGQDLLIAVGGAALYSLYYNPCGWANPAGEAGGHTPFTVFPSGAGVDAPKANTFVNAAGYGALDSLKLAVMLAYYSVHGTFPRQFAGLPKQEVPRQLCVQNSSPNVADPVPTASGNPPIGAGGVGVYADFTTTTAVQHAIQLGWRGIGSTGALGIPNSPYTQELAPLPDKVISDALSQTTGDIWWLSFWTVSWPTGADTFYQGGFAAGKYAAETITGYKGKYVPNYVILDPEGYNTPGNTSTEWTDWLNGWAEGIRSVNGNLKPAFYCNQSQYTTYNLAQINLPAFIAVAPIAGNKPTVHGGNIEGYNAYYAGCPAASDVQQVFSWGGTFSTVQFRDSGVDCAP